ncbi:MAG: hypothetical protein HOO96_39395 [Polyangiaceae bacterium]|nr:hypothetical protein [Polyangiaceae bacterium]
MAEQLDAVLVETIARHFPAARIDGNDVYLGVRDLRIHCVVNSVREAESHTSASLFFWIEGGALGERQVFASVSGYEATPERAIVLGGCNWACSFGPILRAGLAGDVDPELTSVATVVGGTHFAVFVDSIDRTVSGEESPDEAVERVRQARADFGGNPWLLPHLARAPGFPRLPPNQPTVVSLFVADGVGHRTVELKLDGHDVPDSDALLSSVPVSEAGSVAMLRELAVFVPSYPS